MSNSAWDSLAKLRLSGGLVGRICTVGIYACVGLGAIGVSVASHSVWVAAGAVAAIFFLFITLMWRLMSFAERFPPVAILDGEEYLTHQKMFAQKGGGEILINPDGKQEPPAVIPRELEQMHPADIAVEKATVPAVANSLNVSEVRKGGADAKNEVGDSK